MRFIRAAGTRFKPSPTVSSVSMPGATGVPFSSISCCCNPLWWRSVRRTPSALFLIGLSVAIGMWLERYMILVTSLYRDFLVSSWGSYTPSFWDWSTYIGTIGLFMVPFLMVIRLFPVISIFETKEVLEREREEAAQ